MIVTETAAITDEETVGFPVDTGFDPQRGGIGAGLSTRPLIPLMDKGGSSVPKPAPGEDRTINPDEEERREDRRAGTVQRSRAEAV